METPRSFRGLIVVGSFLFVAAVIACDNDQTGASEGITLFEHPNFEGNSVTLAGGFSDFDDLRGPCNPSDTSGNWDDCASSIRVDSGWRGIIFEDPDYSGGQLEILGDIADLEDVGGPCGDDWDDCISSMQVSRR
jgi:Beta/Gamma crystallin